MAAEKKGGWNEDAAPAATHTARPGSGRQERFTFIRTRMPPAAAGVVAYLLADHRRPAACKGQGPAGHRRPVGRANAAICPRATTGPSVRDRIPTASTGAPRPSTWRPVRCCGRTGSVPREPPVRWQPPAGSCSQDRWTGICAPTTISRARPSQPSFLRSRILRNTPRRSGCSGCPALHGDDDLADLLIGLEVGVRIGDLLEDEGPGDHRFQVTRGESGLDRGAHLRKTFRLV